MISPLVLADLGPGALAVQTADGVPLFHYTYVPSTPATESPRPYIHPLHGPTGEVLTNFRPNDHPWHHALSLTISRVGDANFWGGPSHRAEDGYKWRDDQGSQLHRQWVRREPGCLEHTLDWVQQRDGRELLHERRRLEVSRPSTDTWSLRWCSELLNVSGHDLTLGNYHASSGLAGSHYTGLQFRGARELLDQHGDPAVTARGDDGTTDPAVLHGRSGEWMEWDTQHDGTLNRTRLRFEALAGPIPWFLRATLPLVAFAFHREEPYLLPAGHPLVLDHRMTFSRL